MIADLEKLEAEARAGWSRSKSRKKAGRMEYFMDFRVLFAGFEIPLPYHWMTCAG